MRVLLSAVSCSPGRGSEPGFGWNWARSLAAVGHEVTVLTDASWRDAIESARDSVDAAFEYVDVPAATRRHHMAHYAAWQRRALAVARRLDAAAPFDVVHHVTLGSLSGGTPLWRLGRPLVFGPVGGGQTIPWTMLRRLPAGGAGEEIVRAGRVVLAPLLPWVRSTARHAARCLATNRATAAALERAGGRAELFLDSGVVEDELRREPRPIAETGSRALWVGSIRHLKGLPLAIAAVAQVDGAVLDVVGAGPAEPAARAAVERAGVTDRVRFHGSVPRDRVLELLDRTDVFLFTSLRDSFGSQVLEALARGVPTVALALHGVGDMVPDDAAVLVPPGDEAATVERLAAALRTTLADAELRTRLSERAVRYAEAQTWTARARRMTALYEDVVAASR